MNFTEQLAEAFTKKFGPMVSPDVIVKELASAQALEPHDARRMLVRMDFFDLVKKSPERSANDIEHELALKYNVSLRQVQYMRSFRKKRNTVA